MAVTGGDEKAVCSDGEDSKWRSDGLALGVGGTTGRPPVENERSRPGVLMVRFGGRRRDTCCGDSRIGAVHMAGRDWFGGGRRRERFLRLRAFLGASSFVEGTESSEDRGRAYMSARVRSVGRGGMEVGDSGDELGDGSTMMGESKVELVVVGDESVDSEAMEKYSRGKWTGEGKCE